jgi:hypothetical protein
MKVMLGIGAPIPGFGFWGLVDLRHAGAISEPLRLVQELTMSDLAAAAWYTAGQHTLAWAIGLTSVVHHALVYLLGHPRQIGAHGFAIQSIRGRREARESSVIASPVEIRAVFRRFFSVRQQHQQE